MNKGQERRRNRTIKLSNLAALRRGYKVTQVEIAQQMDVSQSAVSRLEHSINLEVPTLERYISALGGKLEISSLDHEGKVFYLKEEHHQHCRLKDLRLTCKMSAQEVATVMGRRMRVVANIEAQTACRLHTVKRYVGALKCRLVVQAIFNATDRVVLEV